MMLKKTLALLVLLPGLAACSVLQQHRMTAPTPVIDGRSGSSVWLESLHEVRDWSPEKQQKALDNWDKAFTGNPDINNRMRLVLLLTLGSEQVRDIRRARRLLDDVDPLPDAEADRELIVILQQMLDEQGQANSKISILWKQVTEQNRRVEELEQQLQALTTIEQNIQSREAPVVIENGK